MARTTGDFTIVPSGFLDAADKLEDTEDRLHNMRDGWNDVVDLLEAEEEQHFAQMGGRYVLTGETMLSLTRSGAHGAIRRLHEHEAVFGTSVWWARFLTKSRGDRENFQVRKPKGDGRSAVLVFRPEAAKRASELMLDWITEPWS